MTGYETTSSSSTSLSDDSDLEAAGGDGKSSDVGALPTRRGSMSFYLAKDRSGSLLYLGTHRVQPKSVGESGGRASNGRRSSAGILASAPSTAASETETDFASKLPKIHFSVCRDEADPHKYQITLIKVSNLSPSALSHSKMSGSGKPGSAKSAVAGGKTHSFRDQSSYSY